MVKTRLLVFLLSLLGIISLILARIFYWQIIAGEKLSVIAQKQRYQVIEVAAPRGKIFTSDNYPLVLNRPAFLIYAYLPNLNLSPEEVARKLAPILVEAPETTDSAELRLKARLSSGRKWVVLARRVTEEAKRKLEELAIDGLGFESEDARDYPEASMAAHVLGFVGYDHNGRPRGYFGLEGFYQQQLQGSPGLLIEEKGVFGRPILSARRVKEVMRPGLNLTLYLERTIQFILEDELKKGIKKYGAKSGWGVVLDPRSGGVLAMASFPNYDPGAYFNFDQKLYPNPVVAEGFEPGSIFKPITMAAALDKGVVEPETRCTQCSGPRRIGDHEIRTWNDKYYPNCTMTEVIEHSDNVGMVFVAEKLGKERILASIREFGFGQKTGIDLQEEMSPHLRPNNQWYPIDLATVSFGQGISVTPIQMIQAFNALANGGILISPRVVKEIWAEDGSRRYQTEREERRVISSKAAKQIKEMLINAVENGEAKWAKPERLVVAGKTGTAQIPIRGHYDEEKTIASFIGFAPADEPKFVMLISLREPTTSPWGSETAAPVWFAIAERLAYYWNLQ